MSALDKLLASRESARSGANHANSANPQVEISNLSEISSPPPSKLNFELERRIRAMAERWHYSTADVEEVLELARQAPDKWLRAVVLDECLAREHPERLP